MLHANKVACMRLPAVCVLLQLPSSSTSPAAMLPYTVLRVLILNLDCDDGHLRACLTQAHADYALLSGNYALGTIAVARWCTYL